MTWFSRWPVEVRLAASLTLIVALGAGALSWSALTTFATGAHIDTRLAWIYPVVVDGLMTMHGTAQGHHRGVGTVAALVLRDAPARKRAYVWALIASAIGVSVAGNAAHASGAVLPPIAAALASAVPAAALAASLHLLVMVVREARAGVATKARARAPRALPSAQRAAAAGRTARASHALDRVRALADEARAQGSPLPTGQQIAAAVGVSAGHARRLRAQVAADVA